jgi:hypothetical protein
MTDRQRWDDEMIARALGAEARRLREAAARRLPSAETLLFRARLRERLEVGERAARLLVLYDRVALTASAAAALALVAWRWDALAAWWGGSAIPSASLSNTGAVLAAGAILVGAALANAAARGLAALRG